MPDRDPTEPDAPTDPDAMADSTAELIGPTGSPWRRHSRRLAYENPWIVVHHDEVTRPDGRPGIYGVVHFQGRAVGIVAIDDEDRVVLVGQFRYTMGHYSWEIPEGGVPDGEDPLAGARRELREETGIEASTWRDIGQLEISNSISDEVGFIYLATGLTDGIAEPDPTEDLRLRHVPFDEVMAMIDRGEIPDALSQLALERVARLRARAEA